MHGQGTFKSDKGDVFVGKFYAGKRKEGRLTYIDTKDSFIGFFENNERVSDYYVYEWGDSGEKYEGNWNEGKKHGFGTHTY